MISLRFIKNLLLRNLGLKLFSLLIACLLWLTMIPEEKIFSEKTLTIPLELHNIPSGIEVVEKPQSKIDVTIRAPNRLISRITPSNVHAGLDLREATVEQEDYLLKNNMISLPEGAEVEDINPSQVNLQLEKSREILMAIEPNLIGEIPQGYRLQKVEVIPPEVKVKGPQSKINKSHKVRTSPINLSTVTQSVEQKVDLILPNPDLRLSSNQTEVKVKLEVQQIDKNVPSF
ncbi:YbbR-like domain-containing protein [bacterium]|nr:YbbR-like domain-containing protein [bacterium]